MGHRKWKEDLVRFHVEFGPDSLFERVRFIMKDIHTLHLNGEHFRKRCAERQIPDEVREKVENFNIDEWKLITAEVRSDRGKFYNCTWEYEFDGFSYWLTIGLGEVGVTIVKKSRVTSTSGTLKCVRSGEFYDFVEEVNQKLMDEEAREVAVPLGDK